MNTQTTEKTIYFKTSASDAGQTSTAPEFFASLGLRKCCVCDEYKDNCSPWRRGGPYSGYRLLEQVCDDCIPF
jgi:hypothetical protein